MYNKTYDTRVNGGDIRKVEVLYVAYNLFYRSTIIVWMAIKFIMQHYFFLRHRIWDGKTREKWNALLAKQAQEYREKAVELGGVLIKVGQFLSTRVDFLPDAFIKELSGLVDRVPAMPFSYARAILEKEWGCRMERYVQSIDKMSIASASIGEVYRARLHDGSVVAIKVQRYRIEKVFRMDFKAAKMVFWLFSTFTSFGKKADLNALYHELITVMDKELDYEQELAYAQYFKTRYSHARGIYIPDYHAHLCSRRVLVMEWIEGAKITDTAYIKEQQIDAKRLARHLFDFYFTQLMNPGYFHADPHDGNILVQADGTIIIIDFGMVGTVTKHDTHHFKRLIRAMMLEDYDMVVDVLADMDFVLPHADTIQLKKMIQQTVDMYDSASFRKIDMQLMDQLKEDIRIFIKDQPIQLPADYAYWGRAVSIIAGVLIHLYPDIDIGEWMKLKVKRWFGNTSPFSSVYTEVVQESLKPLLFYPQAILDWLESGKKDREWDEKKHRFRLKHQLFLLLELLTFSIIVAGIGLFIFGAGNMISMIIIGLGAFLFAIVLSKHYRMLQAKM